VRIEFVTNALRRQLWFKNRIIIFLSLFLALFILDHYIDFILGATRRDILLDVALETPRLVLLFAVMLFAVRELSRERENRLLLHRSLVQKDKEAQAWERRAQDVISEFERDIDSQFMAWGFSKSEREVAYLILKGKTTKEISKLRFTSDRTIRNQCQSIYDKSGLAGRHELSGHFLERFISEH
jgi:DNA-binding CsgD family transcriptional regulator